jgi:hypothetical protein
MVADSPTGYRITAAGGWPPLRACLLARGAWMWGVGLPGLECGPQPAARAGGAGTQGMGLGLGLGLGEYGRCYGLCIFCAGAGVLMVRGRFRRLLSADQLLVGCVSCVLFVCF